MYSVSVVKSFVAQHFLIGGDFGPENFKHSHCFKVQLIIKSSVLDKFNYVVDIDTIKQFLNHIEAKYKDKCLNDFDEFKDQNPSIEYFAKIIHTDFYDQYSFNSNYNLEVMVWEDDDCYASYQ